MSAQTFYTWVLPLCIGAFGVLYALWARWNYDRTMDRWEREHGKTSRPAGE